jgi:hypothetical protein
VGTVTLRNPSRYGIAESMTEQEWQVSSDPGAMLMVVRPELELPGGVGFTLPKGIRRASARKLRLFACACCRAVWDGVPCPRCEGRGVLYTHDGEGEVACAACIKGCTGGLTDPRSRQAVLVAERYADGLATEEELRSARVGAFDVGPSWPNCIAWECTRLDEPCNPCRPAWSVPPEHHAAQAALLREVVGNPFRPAVSETKVWPGRWLYNPAVQSIAQRIYDDRDWDALGILADALEDAGCPQDETYQDAKGGPLPDFRIPNSLLAHLRSPGPHARGCWVADLLLGKE